MVKLSIDVPKGFLLEEAKTLIVPRKRKEVWAVALDLLVQLDCVCKKHGIRYFCDGGTVLGAVRHKGFIPWDDDIDVIMSRVEYDKLNAVAPEEFRHPYFWQTNETDPGSARGHAQLRNSETTGILKSEMSDGRPIYTFNQGLFIDIFPFDSVPDDDAERQRFKQVLKKCKKRISWLRWCQFASRSSVLDGITPRAIYRYCEVQGTRIWEKLQRRDAFSDAVKDLDNLVRMYNGAGTKEVAPISYNPDHREILPAWFFDDVMEVDFEFLKIPIMKQHLKSLTINYGANWREHVIGASAHGGMLIDTDRPYTHYLAK